MSARAKGGARTTALLSEPGFIVTTRKTAARESGADTGCGTALGSTAAFGAVMEIAAPLCETAIVGTSTSRARKM